MNARILEHIINFRKEYALYTMREIITKKIFYQFSVVNNKKRISDYNSKLSDTENIKDLFIIEAMAAKEHWKHFEEMIVKNCTWQGRRPHGKDVANKLLDIGYHYLTNIVAGIFEEINLPCELGLLHIAQSANSKPLVYDFMEWLRPIFVDRTVMVTLRKKKKMYTDIYPKDIAVFINSLKRRLENKYFNKELGYCVTLRFWIRLNALALLSGINHHTFPKYHFPSLRHETRCKKQKTPSKNMLERTN